MKLLLRIALGVLALAAIALGALALFLPSIVRSDAVRQEIQSAARAALGRELRYGELDFGLLPPSLLVVEPAVAGAKPGDPDFAEARRVALRIDLMPLFAREIVVDSLVVEGATVRLVRTAEGIELPGPAPEPAAAPSPAPPKPPPARAPAPGGAPGGEGAPDLPEEAGAGFALALRRLELRDARILVDDRSVTPPVGWELRDVDVVARGESLDQPLDLTASLVLASGGKLDVSGTAQLGGEAALDLEIADLVLAPLAPYLGADVAGKADGTLALRGPMADPQVEADLRLSDAHFALDDVDVRGAVTLRADVESAVERPNGRFELDASQAVLRYGEAFTKPAGTDATAKGRIVTDAKGATVVEVEKLKLRNVDAKARVSLGPPLRVELDSQPVELAGWDALLPALAAVPLQGALRLEGLAVKVDPLDLRGVIHLDDVVATLPDRPPLTLRGALVAKGSAVETRDAVLVAAGQTLAFAARVDELFGGRPRYRLDLQVADAETNALATTFAGKPDTLFGPLDVTGTLSGRIGGGRDVLDDVSGDVRFGIEQGRLAGVSLLEAAFGAMGGVTNLAINLGRIFGGRDVQRFYGDQFEAIRGELHIQDGVAQARELSLLYPGYGADLHGQIGLRDLALDLSGDLILLEELDAVIAREAGAPKGYTGRQRGIPLTAVRGTLDAPEVRVARNVVVGLVTDYAKDVYLGVLRPGLRGGEAGQGGSGDLVDDVLRGVLGGGKRKSNP